MKMLLIPHDVAPYGACRKLRKHVFVLINGVLCFLKFDGYRMEKEKDDWRLHFKEKMSLEEAHHHLKPWIRA